MSNPDDNDNEARGAFQTLGALCGHVATIRAHIECVAVASMTPREEEAWTQITDYLDAVGIKVVKPPAAKPLRGMSETERRIIAQDPT